MGKRVLTEEQKQARREYGKQYRETHREIESERQRRYRENNPEKNKARKRRYLENNPRDRKAEYDRKLLREGKTRRTPLSEEEKAIRRRERYIKNFVSVEKVCEYCGTPFMTQYKKSKTFCSEECASKHSHYMSKVAEKRRKERITSLDTLDRDITLEKLYNRDGGICAICGKPCNYRDYIFQGAVFVAGTDYPSIDHIKPLSKGGSHTWDNVQLSHKLCNSIKSDRFNKN